MAKNTSRTGGNKSDAELGFVDDIPVVKADGTQTTLGEIDPTPASEAAPAARSNGKAQTKPVPKQSAKAQRTSKENAALEATRNKGKSKTDETKKAQADAGKLSRYRDKAETVLTKVDRALARLTDPQAAEYKARI